MRTRLALTILQASTLLLFAQQEIPSAESAFDEGNTLLREKKYCEALARYRTGLAAMPEDSGILYNAGMAAFGCKDFPTALELWNRVKTLDPDDWQVRAKLIQTYQALGTLPERDTERRALFAMRKRGDNEELSEQKSYCRERLEAGGEKVMALEYFEMKGPRAVKYAFSIMSGTGDSEKYRISLGSYDLTNNVWHETTKPKPSPDVRLFHLDEYRGNNHATYGMFAGEPSYEDTRALVVKILEKKLRPASATVANPR